MPKAADAFARASRPSPSLMFWVLPIAIRAFVVLRQVVRILREYERGVIFRLGK